MVASDLCPYKSKALRGAFFAGLRSRMWLANRKSPYNGTAFTKAWLAGYDAYRSPKDLLCEKMGPPKEPRCSA